MARKKKATKKKVVQKETTGEIGESGRNDKKRLRKIPVAKPITSKTRVGMIRRLGNKNSPRRNGKGLRSI